MKPKIIFDEESQSYFRVTKGKITGGGKYIISEKISPHRRKNGSQTSMVSGGKK